MEIGQVIRMVRTMRGVTIDEMCSMTGHSNSNTSLIERGKRDPRWSTVTTIADALDVPVVVFAYLVTNGDEGQLDDGTKAVLQELSLRTLNKLSVADGAQ